MIHIGINSHPAVHSARSASATRGFSLIEMAVVLFVIALLLGSFLVPLVTQVEQRQIGDTQKTLEEIKEALLGFAVSKGYLPCADKTAGIPPFLPNDTPNDGVEDVNTGTGICIINAEGNVPWVTLGLSAAASDVWGNRFRYRVDPDFANRPPAAGSPISLSSAADLNVCATTTCAIRLTSSTAGEGAAVVILSLGKNGLGAINAITGNPNPTPPAGTDENLNVGGSTYVSRTRTGIGTPCSDTVAGQPLCEFDDIVVWLSKYTLFNRMVAASKLP